MRYIRYILFFFTIFFIIAAYNVYKSNLLLDTSIKEIEEKIFDLEQKIFYYDNYLSDFMDTYYYKLIYYHSLGLGLKGEKIIIIDDINKLSGNNIFNKNVNKNKWNIFFQEKFKYIIDN